MKALIILNYASEEDIGKKTTIRLKNDEYEWIEEVVIKPMPSKEELISKILFEVDGGTDDRYISYYDICQRVEQSVNDWFEEIEK